MALRQWAYSTPHALVRGTQRCAPDGKPVAKLADAERALPEEHLATARACYALSKA
jgi:hypothetical protein